VRAGAGVIGMGPPTLAASAASVASGISAAQPPAAVKGEISPECAKPGNHLIKLLITLILLTADRSQHVQDQISRFVAHSLSIIFSRGSVTQFV